MYILNGTTPCIYVFKSRDMGLRDVMRCWATSVICRAKIQGTPLQQMDQIRQTYETVPRLLD